jgi:hypothetical protein
MATFDQIDIREFYEGEERQREYLKDWEGERTIRKCHCGKAYSFEQGTEDPGECASCGGREGDLIY